MIYKLHYTRLLNEFIELSANAFKSIKMACLSSEFQKISKESITVYTSDESGGMVFPEFYYDGVVPLFSVQFLNTMRKAGVVNLFLKRVTITDELQGISRDYYLGLPPRIPLCGPTGEIVESKIGSYQMFKALDIPGDSIYVTDRFKKLIFEHKPLGMEFIEVNAVQNR